MVEIVSENFDLGQIDESGQCFRWRKLEGDHFVIPAFGVELEIAQERISGSEMLVRAQCTPEKWQELWHGYFDLDYDYGAVGRAVMDSDDEYLRRVDAKGQGIRILRQDLWEMIISFMISQNNNIPRIRKSIEKICALCSSDGHFPSPQEMDPGMFDDASLGLGYRAEYLKGMVTYAAEHGDFPGVLKTMDFTAAGELLMGFKGIGKKVAGCIRLFGLHDIGAFPIDTHIKKVLAREYPGGFDESRYPGFAGILQQYMFYGEYRP